jgi:nucleotide-binding universal stress UspA family protein
MKVTIGIPCFNAERWLRRAIESALAQTWPDCEVIVVDDGSLDGSLDVAREFGERIRLFRTDHRGANQARNEVLARASGDWIQFLDADDELEPEKIAQQFAEAAQGAGADVIYSPVWIETTAGEVTDRVVSDTSPQRDIFAQWLAWQIPQTGGALWRRSALESLGGWKEQQPCCQEHELYERALKAGLRFVYAPTPHAIYRVWSDETLCRKDPRLVVRVKTGLIDDLHAWMAERNLWTAEHERIAGRACFEMSRTIALYDLEEAAAYHAGRKARGLIHLEGPAAPRAYRLAYRALGFAMAEKLADRRRQAALVSS